MVAEWGPTPDEKMIVNLPTTVEAFPPNVYADRIEWFGRNFSRRDAIDPLASTRTTTAAPPSRRPSSG